MLYINFAIFELIFLTSKEKNFSSKVFFLSSEEKFPMFEEVFRRKAQKKEGSVTLLFFMQIYN